MTCIHGLDELNCPTCRIIRSTTPLNGISLKNINFLKPNEMVSKKNLNLNEKLIDEIKINKTNSYPPNLILKPKFINEIPDFRNKLSLDKFEEFDISREDNYGIRIKIPLENPEWDFEEEE
ncbi:MAG: hypothetical protein ACFFCV_11225 [Promethearchaeota archaeon]